MYTVKKLFFKVNIIVCLQDNTISDILLQSVTFTLMC